MPRKPYFYGCCLGQFIQALDCTTNLPIDLWLEEDQIVLPTYFSAIKPSPGVRGYFSDDSPKSPTAGTLLEKYVVIPACDWNPCEDPAGLRRYWDFNEFRGATAKDKMAKGNFTIFGDRRSVHYPGYGGAKINLNYDLSFQNYLEALDTDLPEGAEPWTIFAKEGLMNFQAAGTVKLKYGNFAIVATAGDIVNGQYLAVVNGENTYDLNTCNGVTAIIYNGSQLITVNQSGSVVHTVDDVTIDIVKNGKINVGGDADVQYQLQMDELRIYNLPLTPSQIHQLNLCPEDCDPVETPDHFPPILNVTTPDFGPGFAGIPQNNTALPSTDVRIPVWDGKLYHLTYPEQLCSGDSAKSPPEFTSNTLYTNVYTDIPPTAWGTFHPDCGDSDATEDYPATGGEYDGDGLGGPNNSDPVAMFFPWDEVRNHGYLHRIYGAIDQSSPTYLQVGDSLETPSNPIWQNSFCPGRRPRLLGPVAGYPLHPSLVLTAEDDEAEPE